MAEAGQGGIGGAEGFYKGPPSEEVSILGRGEEDRYI